MCIFVFHFSCYENQTSITKVLHYTRRWLLTLWRAAMLALLSIRMAVRMGRSILKPSSDSSPPPSWIQSRAKTVAAAACSSAPPGGNRKIVFVCQWLQLLLVVFQQQDLQHLREEKNVRIFLWMYIICTCVLNESMGLTVESRLSWDSFPGSRWWWGVSPSGSHTAFWRRRPVAATQGLQDAS